MPAAFPAFICQQQMATDLDLGLETVASDMNNASCHLYESSSGFNPQK